MSTYSYRKTGPRSFGPVRERAKANFNLEEFCLVKNRKNEILCLIYHRYFSPYIKKYGVIFAWTDTSDDLLVFKRRFPFLR